MSVVNPDSKPGFSQSMAFSKGPAVHLRYRDALDSAERVRYDAKTKLILNEYPDEFQFDRSEWNDDVKLLPSTHRDR